MCQVNGAGLMLVRVGRLAEALSQLEEALAVSRDLAAQDAGEEPQVPILTSPHLSLHVLTYPHLSSPMLTYAGEEVQARMLTYPHVSSRMLNYAHVC